MRRIAALALLVTSVGLVAPEASAYPRPGRTTRLGPVTDANGADPAYGIPEISGDGRFAVLSTSAPLMTSDTNGVTDCYVQDLETGELERASLADNEAQPNASCTFPTISDDGRVVAFTSTATNLTPGAPSNGATSDVFVRDLDAGTTGLVSVGTGSMAADGASTSAPSVSGDGTRIAFLSSATNLVAGDLNQTADVFVRDVTAGTTEIASIGSDGTPGTTAPLTPSISGDGRAVVFVTRAAWSGDRSPFDDVYVRDLHADRTELISVATDGTPSNGQSFNPSISNDGRHVAFGSFTTNFTPSDYNGGAEAFVRDRQTGVTQRVSLTSQGAEVNNVVGIPIISGNGRYITGNFLPTNYGYADTNGNTDVYVIDRVSGAVELASGTTEGTSTGNAISYYPSISDDGRRVVFISNATDLVDDSGGGSSDVYLRELGPELGAGGATVSEAGDALAVEGWARLGSAALASVGDPATDGSAAAELTRVSATYRPEEEDVLVRIELAPKPVVAAPLAGTTLRRPGAFVYGVELMLGEARHEIRATQRQSVDGATFGLFRCTPTCTLVADLQGGDGTAGEGAIVSVPVEKLGGPGATLGLLRGFVAAGDGDTARAVLDEVALAPVTIPVPSVMLGGSAESIDVPATLSAGRFSGSVPGDSGVWARVCLGTDCRVTRLD